MKKAVFLYDFTGIMAKPWLDAGYECWIIDGQNEHGYSDQQKKLGGKSLKTKNIRSETPMGFASTVFLANR